MFGFTADHEHVVELFHKIADNGYQIVYLTARSIAQDVDTREYLFEVSKKKIVKINLTGKFQFKIFSKKLAKKLRFGFLKNQFDGKIKFLIFDIFKKSI